MLSKCAFTLALLAFASGLLCAYPQNLLSQKLGASVSTTAKIEGNEDPNKLLSDGPVSKGGFVFLPVVQAQVFTVDLGAAKTFDRIQLGTGRDASHVKISIADKSADGPYKQIFEKGEIGYWQNLRLPVVKARWIRFDFGTAANGSHIHSVRIYKSYKHPKLAQVTKLLYERIKPGLPGLEKFYAAAKKGDWPKACKALRAYYAAKKKPDAKNPKYDTAMVQDILDGKHDYAGISRVEKFPWDWNYSKNTDWYEHKNFINRGNAIGRPMVAYWNTGDKKWLKLWREVFLDWIDENPKPEIMSGADYPSWRTLDSAARVGWIIHVFPLSTAAKGVDDETWANHLYSIWEHSDYIKNDNFTGGNWLAHSTSAVLGIATGFPEFRDEPKWLEYGKTSFETNVLRDIYPDGKEVEDAPGYVAFAYAPMVGTLATFDKAGIEVNPEVRRRMDKVQDFLAAVTQPDGLTPAIGDSGGGDAYSLPAAQEIFKRQDIKYILTKGKEGAKPAWDSINFPDGQWSIMRSAYDEKPYENARHLVFKTSSGSHGHNDVMQIVVYAYGRRLLIDPGIRSYEAADVERYLHTNYHNTICVDGKSQSRGGGKTARWFSNAGMDYVYGTFEGYKSLFITRGVVFVKRGLSPAEGRGPSPVEGPDYWIVLDDVQGEGDHTYDQNWHFDSDANISTDPATKAVHTGYPSGGNLLMLPVSTDGLESKIKDFFIAKDSINDGTNNTPSKGWTYTRKGAPPQAWDLILYPYNGAAVPQVTSKRLKVDNAPDAIALQVNANGYTDYVFVSRAGAVSASIPEANLKVDAELAVVRVRDGKPVRVSGANVKSVTLGESDLISLGERTVDVDKTME